MNPLLAQQIKAAAKESPDGKARLSDLLELISRQYDTFQKENPPPDQPEPAPFTETRLQRFVESSLDAVVLFDGKAQVMTWSVQAEEIFGWSVADAQSCNFVQTFIAQPFRAAVALGLQRYLVHGKGPILDNRLEIQALHRDGHEFPLELAIAPLKLGERQLFCAFFRDITERVHAQRELAESEARYRVLFDSAPEAILVLDADTNRFLGVNEQAAHLFGIGRRELLQKPLLDLCPPTQPNGRSSAEMAKQKISEALTGETPVFEWMHIDAAGTPIPCEIQLVRMPPVDRNIVRGVVTDLRERKKAQRERRETEARFRSLFENVLDGVYRSTPEGRILSANPAFLDILGYGSEAEVKRLDIARDLYANPGDRCDVQQRLDEAGQVRDLELRLKRRDGGEAVVLLNCRAISNEHDKVVSYEGTITDITARKRAEEERGKAIREFERIAKHSMQCFWSATLSTENDLTYIYVSPAFTRIFGYKPDELYQDQDLWAATVMPDDRPILQECLENVRANCKRQSCSYRVCTKGDEIRWVEDSITPVIDADSNVVGFDGVVMDTTERRRAGELLATQRRILEMTATGTNVLDIFEQLCVDIEELVPESICSILLLKDGELEFAAGPSVPEVVATSLKGVVPGTDTGAYALAVATRATVIIRDMTADTVSKTNQETAEKLGVKAAWSVPIIASDGDVLGTFAINRIEPSEPDKEQTRILRTAANLAGIVLQRQRSEESRNRMMTILESTPDFVALMNRDGQPLYLNKAGRKMLGLTSEDDLADVRLEDFDSALLARYAENSSDTEAVWHRQARIVTRDEVVIPTSQVIVAHKSPAGQVEYFSTIARDVSERERAANALRDSERRFRAIFNQTFQLIGLLQPDGCVLEANRTALRYAQLPLESVVGKFLWKTPWFKYSSDARERARKAVEDAARGSFVRFEMEVLREGYPPMTFDFSVKPVTDEHGNIVLLLPEARDITERKLAERAIFEEKERAQVTLESIGDAVITTDATGRVNYMNPIAEEITAWTSQEAANRPIAEVFQIHHETTKKSLENPVLRCLREGRVVGLGANTVLQGRSGEEVAIQDSAAPIRDRDGAIIGAVIVFHDVSEERQLHRRLSHQATHDSLTGLINRREFENRLDEALARAAENEGDAMGHVLLYLDLDQFKVVNDTCGHSAGDQLLKQVTGILKKTVRSTDVLARLGGDEFSVLLENCPLEDAIEVAESVRRAVSDFRFVWNDRIFDVTVSIGLVGIASVNTGAAGVLGAADVACYAAKDMGRNRVHVYQEGDATQRHKEMQWVSRVTQACEENRLVLFHQPIASLDPQRCGSRHYHELLLRMSDKHGRLVPPKAFLPAAERYNLMTTIDRWVIEHTLGELIDNGESDQARYTLAINLSASSVCDESFLIHVKRLFEQYRPVHDAICFEITEAAAISHLAQVAHFVSELKELGCLFALDDFGSGLSSFAYLKSLPVDFLKIDGHFVRNIVDDSIDRRLVDSINKIGHELGVRTIAEGVESEDIVDALISLGIDYAQGFYYDRPERVVDRGNFRKGRPALSVVRAS